jgi:3-hydroxybutyryl-CoA dehydrogenase
VGKLCGKGQGPGQPEEIMARIHTSTDLAGSAGADLVIEAVFENLELKLELLAGWTGIISGRCLVASNTSAIRSASWPRAYPPGEFLGLHFFNPVPMMQAVEVIRGILTSDETFEAGRGVCQGLGQGAHNGEPRCARVCDQPHQLSRHHGGHAPGGTGGDHLRGRGQGLKLASGRKMGIFEISDMVGLDVTYGGLMAMYKETGEERWFPPMILRRKVKAGHLGRKTGKGWYEYNPDGSRKE